MPQITIIIPVYNAEKTLRRCVQSILMQTYTDWELLLIDDGSKDNSGKICDEYAAQDSRVRVFHQKNGGASFARNIGLSYVSGEWIAFCDSDDWVDGNWLELFDKQIKGDGDVELVVQGFIPHANLWKEKTGMNFRGEVKTGILKLSDERVLGYLWSKMFKREIVEKYHLYFDTTLSLREDELFVLEYMECISCMSCVKEGAYHYVIPDFSAKYGNIDLFDMFLKIYVVLKRIFCGEHNRLLQSYVNELTQSLFYSFTMRHGDRREKLVCYRKEVGKQVRGMETLSWFSKYILAYSPSVQVAYLLLEVKERIVQYIK